MNTVVGVCATEHGLCSKEVLEQGPTRPELRFKAWMTDSAEIRSTQPRRIPVNLEHGPEVGEVLYIERRQRDDGNLWLVAEVDAAPTVGVKVGDETVYVESDYYWSLERRGGGDYGIQIDAVALTRNPARIAARPLQWFPGRIHERSGWTSELHFMRPLLERAAEAHITRRASEPLIVHDQQPSAQNGFDLNHAAALDVRPPGQMHFRSATQVGVDAGARTIELIVMPAEEPALVAHQGRMVTEIVSHGAFAGTEDRAGRIKVNRDHDRGRPVGLATSLDPYSELGLVGTLRIARTPLGDETLALANEAVLDCSAGFLPVPPDGEVWETRSRRRITAAWLGHIAMVSEPAYEGARVLSVRDDEADRAWTFEKSKQSATPNRDALRALELGEQYEALAR